MHIKQGVDYVWSQRSKFQDGIWWLVRFFRNIMRARSTMLIILWSCQWRSINHRFRILCQKSYYRELPSFRLSLNWLMMEDLISFGTDRIPFSVTSATSSANVISAAPPREPINSFVVRNIPSLHPHLIKSIFVFWIRLQIADKQGGLKKGKKVR